MRLRTYTVSQKYVKNKYGDIGVYKKKIKKWIKSSQPYRPRKRGQQKLSIYSIRFGYLDLYNRKEQQELTCPSGFSISQCFNALRKLWYAYRRAIGTEKDIEKMKKYAKAIQNVQKDMGIKTASFPHLGLFGDELILRPKNGVGVIDNNSTLKKKQEEYSCEKQDYENTVPMLLKPDKEKGEEIQILVDPIPFPRRHRRRRNRNGDSSLPIPYDEIPDEELDEIPEKELEAEIEDAVPALLKPEQDEEVLILSDNIPFRS